MSGQAGTLERRVLQRMKERYELRGYDVIVSPPPDLMPPFLSGLRADAIALGPDGGVVIEVRMKRRPENDRHLSDLAARVAAEPGWQLDVLYANEAPEDEMPLAPASAAQIADQIAEVERLRQDGHVRAAFIAGWSILESIARLIGGASRLGAASAGTRVLSPWQIVEILAMQGHLEPAMADRMQALARLRNAAVHGDFAVVIDGTALDELLAVIRSLQPWIGTVAAP